MKVTMITAIYDGYDDLKPPVPQQNVDADWVVVTDDPSVADDVPGWRVVHVPRPGVSSFRAAKAPKYRPWDYTSSPASVWIDGSVSITSPSLAEEFLAAADPVASFAHPQRDCVYEECIVSLPMSRYAGEPLVAQAEHYHQAAHPAHWGLWETTVVARHHTPEVIQLGDAWAAEMDAWSSQDQMSFPFVLRNLGMRAAVMPGAGRGSPWHCWGGSWRH
jgi:hypothetical protein